MNKAQRINKYIPARLCRIALFCLVRGLLGVSIGARKTIVNMMEKKDKEKSSEGTVHTKIGSNKVTNIPKP